MTRSSGLPRSHIRPCRRRRDGRLSGPLLICCSSRPSVSLNFFLNTQCHKLPFNMLKTDVSRGQALRDNAAAADWTFGSSVLPVAVLAKPVELRFQYHFMGNKSTNRLDKASLLQSSAVQRVTGVWKAYEAAGMGIRIPPRHIIPAVPLPHLYIDHPDPLLRCIIQRYRHSGRVYPLAAIYRSISAAFAHPKDPGQAESAGAYDIPDNCL